MRKSTTKYCRGEDSWAGGAGLWQVCLMCLAAVFISLSTSTLGWADIYHVSIDLSALGGSGFRLLADLHSTFGPTGSSVWMDNVVVGAVTDDFEGFTLGGFQNDLNLVRDPATVRPVAGAFGGVGLYVMQIEEDPDVSPTSVYRDYPGGNTLSFDLETRAGSSGTFDDEFVISIFDSGWNPLLVGLNGFGDVLMVTSSGLETGGLTAVPAPAALLLGLVGFGAGGIGLRRGRSLLA